MTAISSDRILSTPNWSPLPLGNIGVRASGFAGYVYSRIKYSYILFGALPSSPLLCRGSCASFFDYQSLDRS